MKLVTDAAANLSPERAAELGVEVIPFQVTFMDKTYRDGVDIQPGELYHLYTEHPEAYPQTSQPSVGDFLAIYEKVDVAEEILSVHLSSGLSGTYSSAEHAARMLPDKKITTVDSRTVGPALGWMVEAAAYGIKHAWPKERILDAMQRIRENTITMVSFSDMKYLIHSGRVSHIKTVMASILRIKPIIGMNYETGLYSNIAAEMTVRRAAHKMVNIVHERFGDQKLRLQLMHGDNLPDAAILKEAVNGVLNATEEKLVPVTLVLGAHAGPTVIGLAAAPQAVFDGLYQ
jgi:DegV family protein with EDD domain